MAYGVRLLCAFTLVTAATVWVTLELASHQALFCRLPAGVTERSFPNGVPMALRNAIKDRVGEIVPPGEKFDKTDVVVTEPAKFRRTIFVWVRGARWVIATEHGGRAYNNPIFVFDVNNDGLEATLVNETIAFPDSVCAVALRQIE